MTKRSDNRKLDELRNIKIELGRAKNAEGSCYLEWGKNIIIATVNGPKPVIPRHLSNPQKAVIDYKYRMACFSVGERKSPAPGRRDREISLVSGRALEAAIMVEEFPNTLIDINVVILSADAGTRVAALAAASLAAADAGLPMRGMISAVAAGRANNQLMVDLTKEEEDYEDAVDMACAFLMPQRELVLLQMDGFVKKEDCSKILESALVGSEKVYDLQKKALIEKYPLEGEIKL